MPTRQPPADDLSATIISLGHRAYRVGLYPPVVVSRREHTLLQAFLKREVMDQTQLPGVVGYDVRTCTRLLSRLRTKYDGIFEPAIHMAVRKGAGGYRVCVKAP